MSAAKHTPVAERFTRRAAREREYGVTCYEYQAMLEVDHADWPKHSAEMAERDRNGIGYTTDEADLAIVLIHQWVRESGVDAVRQALTDAIGDRRNHDGSRRICYAGPRAAIAKATGSAA